MALGHGDLELCSVSSYSMQNIRQIQHLKYRSMLPAAIISGMGILLPGLLWGCLGPRAPVVLYIGVAAVPVHFNPLS
jgi:hypothetical protein